MEKKIISFIFVMDLSLLIYIKKGHWFRWFIDEPESTFPPKDPNEEGEKNEGVEEDKKENK